ncbi:hypothetical protein QUA81_06980 [Microcoleus sp. F6_B4]
MSHLSHKTQVCVKVFPSLQKSGHKAREIQLALLLNGGWESNEAVAAVQSF